jgi:hypothetical protein
MHGFGDPLVDQIKICYMLYIATHTITLRKRKKGRTFASTLKKRCSSTARLEAEILDYGFEDPRIHTNTFWIRETTNDY